jgi:hypothetical protein
VPKAGIKQRIPIWSGWLGVGLAVFGFVLMMATDVGSRKLAIVGVIIAVMTLFIHAKSASQNQWIVMLITPVILTLGIFGAYLYQMQQPVHETYTESYTQTYDDGSGEVNDQPVPGVQPDHAPTQAQLAPAPAEETYAQPPKTTQPKAAPGKKLSNVAHFQHFDVRILGSTAPPGPAEVVYHLQSEVCLTKEVKGASTRISTDPWSVYGSDGWVKPSRHVEAGEAGNFPREAMYRKGDCAVGWMTFKTNGLKVTKIRYSNSLGDVAVWDAGLGQERIR